PEYAHLNAIQLAVVRDAQVRKNAAIAKTEEALLKLRQKLLGNNTAHSSMIGAEGQRLSDELDAKVEAIVEDLKYTLSYDRLMQGENDQGPYSYPSNPNYYLTPPDRFLVVRSYYMLTYTDAATRLQIYEKDTLAQHYLGEFYFTLREIFAKYVNEG
ncbi:MAG: hypothetical protein K2N84_05710, partial [Clostridia bacterium]|nr:hypothetical protein [Clostridia bacterium]